MTITKRGRVVAVLVPPENPPDNVERLYGLVRGTVTIPPGFDLTAPVIDEPLDADEGVLHR